MKTLAITKTTINIIDCLWRRRRRPREGLWWQRTCKFLVRRVRKSVRLFESAAAAREDSAAGGGYRLQRRSVGARSRGANGRIRPTTRSNLLHFGGSSGSHCKAGGEGIKKWQHRLLQRRRRQRPTPPRTESICADAAQPAHTQTLCQSAWRQRWRAAGATARQ